MHRPWLAVLVTVAALAPAQAQTPEQKQATVAFLRGLQATDGGFLPAPPGESPPKSSLRATTAALRGLKYFGGTPRDREACLRFVAGCFDKASGGFRDQPGAGTPDVITTAVGLMAVVELKMPRDRYSPAAVTYLGDHAKSFEEIRMAAAGLEAVSERTPQAAAWREQVLRMRNPDGTYGKGDGAARATGGAVVTLLRLGTKVDQADQVVRALREGQRADGGFGKEGAAGSDLESSYRIVRAFVMLKAKPVGGAGCRRFVVRCRNADGGYGVAPGQPSSVGATYFAAIIRHWLAEE